jgi:heme/copper-type cytochrome/quinol oxidase subunit 4
MWNIINISSLILNAFVVIADLSGLKERNLVPCLAIATLLMWFRLFYFGRMSSRTAGMVRMIYSVFTKIGNFLIILLIMVLGFANIFFIMSRIENNGFIGDSYWDALTYSYL